MVQVEDDEQRLRQIQQDLVHAWRERDRAVVESILAPTISA